MPFLQRVSSIASPFELTYDPSQKLSMGLNCPAVPGTDRRLKYSLISGERFQVQDVVKFGSQLKAIKRKGENRAGKENN